MAKKAKPAVLNKRQKALVKELANGARMDEAAIAAGYSPKWPASSANQALRAIREKTPDIMDRLGLSVESLIKNHLKPLLKAEETKFFAHEGKVKQRINVRDYTTRRFATRLAFELQDSFPHGENAENVSVRVVILDAPRPDRTAIEVTTNGHKPPEED